MKKNYEEATINVNKYNVAKELASMATHQRTHLELVNSSDQDTDIEVYINSVTITRFLDRFLLFILFHLPSRSPRPSAQPLPKAVYPALQGSRHQRQGGRGRASFIV